MKRTHILFLSITIVILALIGAHFFETILAQKHAQKMHAKALLVKNNFSNISYDARAVCIVGENGKIIYEKNGSVALPLASMTKVMTAIIAAFTYTPTDTFFVDKNTWNFTDFDKALLGHTWSFESLLSGLLINSSNTAADTLANITDTNRPGLGPETPSFVIRMNDKARELGLGSFVYRNPSGLDIGQKTERTPGAIGSACDSAKLILELQRSFPIYAAISTYPMAEFSPVDNPKIKALATNTDPLTTERNGILASKTGTTTLAGGNLSLVYGTSGQTFGIVVMGAKDENARVIEMRKLLDNTDIFAVSLNEQGLTLSEYYKWLSQ